MFKNKVITSFSKLSDGELEQKAELIFDSLTGNENFPEPIPSLTSLRGVLSQFDLTIVKAKEGGRTEQILKNSKRRELTDMLNNLALYVQLQGDGNEAILASSGFSLSRPPQPIGMLDKPQNFSVSPNNPGMVKLNLKAIYGAKSYRFEYRKKTEESWEVTVSTKSGLLLTGLESGVAYEFRVAGVGTNTQRIYSDILSSFIL